MDLGFGKFRQFYIVNMIFGSLVTFFHAKSWDSRNMVNQWNVPTPGKCTYRCSGYVSKRKFFCNRPLYALFSISCQGCYVAYFPGYSPGFVSIVLPESSSCPLVIVLMNLHTGKAHALMSVTYRAGHLEAVLGWMWLGQMRIRQYWHSSRARWWNIQDHCQPNPGPRPVAVAPPCISFSPPFCDTSRSWKAGWRRSHGRHYSGHDCFHFFYSTSNPKCSWLCSSCLACFWW